MVEDRRCNRCRELKPASAFHRLRDGRQPRCIACVKEVGRSRIHKKAQVASWPPHVLPMNHQCPRTEANGGCAKCNACTHKKCSSCKGFLPFAKFNKDGRGARGLQTACVHCQQTLTWRSRYGIDAEAFARIAHRQGVRCAGCEVTLDLGRNTHIDHDHVSGVVRGLLCQNCNMALGSAKDSPSTLRRLATYLEESECLSRT